MLPSAARADLCSLQAFSFLNLCWQPCREVTKDYKSVGCILNMPAMPCLTDHTHLPLKLLTLRCSAPINEAQRCQPAMCVCECARVCDLSAFFAFNCFACLCSNTLSMPGQESLLVVARCQSRRKAHKMCPGIVVVVVAMRKGP